MDFFKAVLFQRLVLDLFQEFMMTNPRLKQILFLLLFSGFACCNSDFSHTQIKEIPVSGWNKDSVLTYDFKVEGPIAPVDFLYQVQFNEDYSFENIWLDYSLIGPKGEILTASRDNLTLFEPKTGKPLGVGGKNRIFLDAYFLKGVRLKDTGRYQLKLKQYMRQDHLLGIQSMGLKVRPIE